MEKVIIKNRIGRGETLIAEMFSEAFPNHTIILDGGPDRPHDIRYEIDNQEKVVHVDVNYPALTLRPNVVMTHVISSINDIKARKLNQVI